MGNLSLGDLSVVFLERDGLAQAVHGEADIPPDEVLNVLDRVDSSVALLANHETFEWSDWLGLRCVSLMHFVYFLQIN